MELCHISVKHSMTFCILWRVENLFSISHPITLSPHYVVSVLPSFSIDGHTSSSSFYLLSLSMGVATYEKDRHGCNTRPPKPHCLVLPWRWARVHIAPFLPFVLTMTGGQRLISWLRPRSTGNMVLNMSTCAHGSLLGPSNWVGCHNGSRWSNDLYN